MEFMRDERAEGRVKAKRRGERASEREISNMNKKHIHPRARDRIFSFQGLCEVALYVPVSWC